MRTLLKENSLNSADISIQQYDQIPRPGWLKEFIGKHWILVFTAIFGLYAGLPFLAPIFMHSGWTGVGKGIYLIYSFLCHQLSERSFFFFGPKISYSLQEISATGVNTSDFLELR